MFDGKGYKQYLHEKAVAMQPRTWNDPNGKTGESRTAILLDRVKKKQPLQLADGGVVHVDILSYKELEAAISSFQRGDIKQFNVKTKEKGEISASKLAKADYFGGGGGAGGGTDQTAIAEPQTCVYIHAMLENGVNSADFYSKNPDILKKAFTKVSVGKAKWEKIEALIHDESWHMSAWLSAKALIDGGYVKKGMTFHRDSKQMNDIYRLAKIAFKNSDLKPMSNDKWNPGDIWAFAKGFKPSDLDVSSIGAFNKDLLGLYINRKIVGISLKKVTKTVQVKEENIKMPPETESYKILAYRLKGKQRGTVWTNKSGQIEFDKGTIDIKANKYMGSHKMELKGKGARGGGAGWQTIQNAGKKHLKKKLPDTPHLKKMAVKISRGDKKAIGMFHGMLNAIESLPLSEVEENLANKKGPGDPGWIMSKLAAAYIIYYMHKHKGTKANDFITAIVNYAGSKSEESGPYIIVKA